MEKILEKVAVEYDVSKEEVENEIMKALEMARLNESEESKRFWGSVLNDNEPISMEKVFAAIISEVHKQL